MAVIKQIHGREILDSRGNPTVEVDVILDSGIMGRACAPAGASTGVHEAVELRDKDLNRYEGKGVKKAVENVNTVLQQAVVSQDPLDQEKIDKIMIELDGNQNKSHLGANAILAVSLATAKAAAASLNQPLYQYIAKISHSELVMPVPMMNIINGGVHADNNVDIQEFLIIPAGAPTYSESLRYGVEVFHVLKKLLHDHGLNSSVGDEGGFAPSLPTNETAIEIIIDAIHHAGYEAGKDIYIGLDAASSEIYRKGVYYLESEHKQLDSDAMVDYLSTLIEKYPILSVEDGMAEEDWKGWKVITARLGRKVQLIGDDLFVTNMEILQRGIKENVANSILIKPNQIGTLTETLAAIKMAKGAGYTTVVSHRSGETEDTFIADLAVGTGAGQIKTGSLCRTDRMAKYNQLLRIESELQGKVPFPGRNALTTLK